MRLGIVGAGKIVQEFLPMLNCIEGLEIVGIQGRSLDKVQAICEQGDVAHALTSFDDLVALGLDCVYVAVPNNLHFDYAMRALRAGLNVIVEKPLCSNADEARALADFARSSGLFLFEAITALHLPAFEQVRAWIGRIGTIKLVSANFSQYSSRYDAFRAGVIQPAFDPACSGGALMDLNLYNVHWVVDLFGMPDGQTYYANVERDIDTSGTLVLRYPSFIATCIAAKDCAGPSLYAIQGTDGYINLDLNPGLVGTAHLHLNDGHEESLVETFANRRAIPEFRAFVDCIEANDHTACEAMLERSLAVADVMDAARKDAGIVFPADLRSAGNDMLAR